jgi:hypothetical protein
LIPLASNPANRVILMAPVAENPHFGISVVEDLLAAIR